MVSCVGLQCVTVAFPVHTHFLTLAPITASEPHTLQHRKSQKHEMSVKLKVTELKWVGASPASLLLIKTH